MRSEVEDDTIVRSRRPSEDRSLETAGPSPKMGPRRTFGRESMADKMWRFRGILAVASVPLFLILAVVTLMPSAQSDLLRGTKRATPTASSATTALSGPSA